HCSAVFRRKSRRCAREKLACAPRFEFHQTNETLIVLPILQLRFGIIETRQILLWQVDAAVPQIFPDVTNNIRHLQRQPKLKRIDFAARIAISKNLDAHEADRTGDPIAINTELLEGGIS